MSTSKGINDSSSKRLSRNNSISSSIVSKGQRKFSSDSYQKQIINKLNLKDIEFMNTLKKMQQDYETIIAQKDIEVTNLLIKFSKDNKDLQQKINSLENENYKLKEINKLTSILESSKNGTNYYDNIFERKKNNEKKSNKFEEAHNQKIEGLKREFEEFKKKIYSNLYQSNTSYSFSNEESMDRIMNDTYTQIDIYQKEILELTEKNFQNEKLIMKLNCNIESLKEENNFIKRTVIQEKENLLNEISKIKQQNFLEIYNAKNIIFNEKYIREKLKNSIGLGNNDYLQQFDKEKLTKLFEEKDKIVRENVDLFTKVSELDKKTQSLRDLINESVRQLENEQRLNLTLKRKIYEMNEEKRRREYLADSSNNE